MPSKLCLPFVVYFILFAVLGLIDAGGVPTEILVAFLVCHFGRDSARAVAVRREVERFPLEVGDVRFARDVAFLLELAEVAPVHDNELAIVRRRRHDIVAFSRFQMSFIGFSHCLPQAEGCF